MSNDFWTSRTGTPITGKPDDAFVKNFSIIPEGTQALAMIKSFEIVEKTDEYKGPQKFIQIIYKLSSGEFIGREVTQKIRPFDGEPKGIDRNLNMLRLIMELCGFKPNHQGEPTNQELMSMNNKIVGIKIGEWAFPKNDGSGMMEGNHVREVWAATGFESETGIKVQHIHSIPVDSALSRNSNSRTDGVIHGIDDDIPF